MAQHKPKIILWDLETIPNLREAMRVWPSLGNYPGLTLKASITSIICVGWKHLGLNEPVQIKSAWDYDRWTYNINDDYEVVKFAHDLLHECDGIVTHNGKRFDLPHLQTRIMWHRRHDKSLAPLPPKLKHIDTCQVAKRLFVFNNRLNTLSQFLGHGKKLENGGWELWDRVYDRDPAAMQLMADYCKQDVALLEKVFLDLRPFADQIPNYGLFTVGGQGEPVCPSCGSLDIQRRGEALTKTRVWQRLHCQECGSWSRVAKHGVVSL